MAFQTKNNTIRSATPADRLEIIKLVSSILGEFGQSYDPTGSERDLEEFECYLYQPGWGFYVMILDNKIVGTIGLQSVSSTEGKLKKMYVNPSFRNFGVGHSLVEHLINAAKEMGYKKLYLETMTAMKSAIHLYEKYGFTPANKIAQSYRCDVVMEKTL